MIARPERPSRRARRVALQDARDAGCVCRPEVVIRDKDCSPHAWSACVFHDPWCPAIRSRDGNGTAITNVVVYLDDSGEAR
jgi:hypothetical protein